jgi:acyl-coenzyme A synthetase/AMP-(fatty) acid ligase
VLRGNCGNNKNECKKTKNFDISAQQTVAILFTSGTTGEAKKNPILPYKWLFWWVFNFRFFREDVKCAKKVHELLFHVQIVKQVIYTPVRQIIVL